MTSPPVRALTEGELQATVTASPRPCGVGEEVWTMVEAYVERLPVERWQDHEPAGPGTPVAYAMRGGRWVHVLVDTADRRVTLVVVLNLADGVVHGHRLLDLRPAAG